MPSERTIPPACRLNLWHSWRPATTPDGSRYITCVRCRKDKPDRHGTNTIGA